MSFSVEVLAGIAIELQRGIGHQDPFSAVDYYAASGAGVRRLGAAAL